MMLRCPMYLESTDGTSITIYLKLLALEIDFLLPYCGDFRLSRQTSHRYTRINCSVMQTTNGEILVKRNLFPPHFYIVGCLPQWLKNCKWLGFGFSPDGLSQSIYPRVGLKLLHFRPWAIPYRSGKLSWNSQQCNTSWSATGQQSHLRSLVWFGWFYGVFDCFWWCTPDQCMCYTSPLLPNYCETTCVRWWRKTLLSYLVHITAQTGQCNYLQGMPIRLL